LFDIKSFGTLDLSPVSAVSVSGLQNLSDLIEPIVRTTINCFESVSHAPKSILAPLASVFKENKSAITITIVQ
jgi:hypothetical protein